MTHYANRKRDDEIKRLVEEGQAPKIVWRVLRLTNIWVVYRVMRKFRGEQKRQISPKTNLEI